VSKKSRRRRGNARARRQQGKSLAIPIVVISIAGPVVDVTGRMTALGAPRDIRTRLMSLYIVLMFLGGGAGSWAGTIAYELLCGVGSRVQFDYSA